ncbi:hypothetical protein EKO04_006951 [Ascochyta lentis]|uniref:Uncharacterized protein n=1 Tax=Ascochyta lentis TaxID=205686 RepID=A0A8H7J1T8_9PLEO|nr:hypothetical protein EKO04_006951 [Ascochyta lentis]
MDSIERMVHIEGRSASHTTTHDRGSDDVVKIQQPTNPTSSSSPLPTVRIQQATISTSQRFTVPSDTMSLLSSPTMPATVTGTEPAAHSQEKGGLSSKSIAGLAMIPVAVILIAVAIFIYFCMRKRRRHMPAIRHLGSSPPPVPAKDFRSPTSSFDSMASGGKVRSMSAMSTPIMHTGWHASPRPQTHTDAAVHHNPWNDQLPKISADITTAGYAARRVVEEGNDSPIDRSSPFRLKRGDTKKRSSLDPEVMSAWPAPPQPVQPAPLQPLRIGKTYMERRSISSEYFAQERAGRDGRGAQEYWEDIRLELGPDPGPTVKA